MCVCVKQLKGHADSFILISVKTNDKGAMQMTHMQMRPVFYPGLPVPRAHTMAVLTLCVCVCVCVCVWMFDTNLGIGAIFAQHLVEGARQLSLRCLNRSQNLWGRLRKHLQGKQRRDRGKELGLREFRNIFRKWSGGVGEPGKTLERQTGDIVYK